MASHFQTEAWVTREWPIDLITSCGLGNELTLPFPSGEQERVRRSSGSLRKHPFLLALHRWGRFVRRNVCDSARNVPSGEERGEMDVFAG